MSIIEIRCPRCASVSHLKNKETHEYSCDHCNATFVFLDTTKKEIITDVRRHNCPLCGRAVKVGEGNLCTQCKKVDLCEKCVDEVSLHDNKIWCKECIKEKKAIVMSVANTGVEGQSAVCVGKENARVTVIRLTFQYPNIPN